MDEQKASYRIMDLPEAERPRERLARLGPQALNNAELLAILLRVGVRGENAVQVGQRILQTFGGLSGLHIATVAEVQAQHGVGEAKAAALVMYEMSALEQEHLRVMLLNTRNQVLDIIELYHGSLNASMVRVGEVFMPAVRRNAASILVVHNHPSGNPTPSPDGVAVTKAIIAAGKLLDIDVLDHIVIGQGRFVSLKERRLGFE